LEDEDKFIARDIQDVRLMRIALHCRYVCTCALHTLVLSHVQYITQDASTWGQNICSVR